MTKTYILVTHFELKNRNSGTGDLFRGFRQHFLFLDDDGVMEFDWTYQIPSQRAWMCHRCKNIAENNLKTLKRLKRIAGMTNV